MIQYQSDTFGLVVNGQLFNAKEKRIMKRVVSMFVILCTVLAFATNGYNSKPFECIPVIEEI